MISPLKPAKQKVQKRQTSAEAPTSKTLETKTPDSETKDSASR